MAQPLRIVVADDDEELLYYYARMIPYLGHVLLANVKDGLALVDTCLLAAPDLAVSDIQIPKLDGVSAMERVQREADIPFIFISADDEAKHHHRIQRGNVLAYLRKPIHRHELSAALDSAGSRVTVSRGNANLQHKQETDHE